MINGVGGGRRMTENVQRFEQKKNKRKGEGRTTTKVRKNKGDIRVREERKEERCEERAKNRSRDEWNPGKAKTK